MAYLPSLLFSLAPIKCILQLIFSRYIQSCLEYETHVQGTATLLDSTVKRQREPKISVFDFH